MTFSESIELVARLFEGIAALVLLGGLLIWAVLAVRSYHSSHDGRKAYRDLRESFGGIILLGLGLLVAADLVRTVAIAPTMENVPRSASSW
jgi:uncharacterized membrane protein